jgi:hypothetical protein
MNQRQKSLQAEQRLPGSWGRGKNLNYVSIQDDFDLADCVGLYAQKVGLVFE